MHDKNWMTGEQLWGWKFLHGYPVMIFLGLLSSFFTIVYFWKRYKYSWEILQILTILTVPIAVFGAKFYTMVVDGGWDTWYQLSGLSIYGALIFSIPTGMIYLWTKRNAVDFRTAVSIVVPSIIIGQAVGRWGNFFNHEVYGDVVSGDSLNWTTDWIKSNMYIGGEYRSPLFLYEFIISFVGYFVIVWIFNRKSTFKPGVTAGIYMIWYGIERLILQLFRDPSQTSFIGSSDVPLNLVVSILAIILGIILSIWFQIFTRPLLHKELKFKIRNYKKTIKIHYPDAITKHIKHEYEAIYPVKPRKIYFSEKKDKKIKRFILFGKDVYISHLLTRKQEVSMKKYIFFGKEKTFNISLLGHFTNYKKKYWLFGPKVENKIKLYIPKKNNIKWSKKEINKGKRN